MPRRILLCVAVIMMIAAVDRSIAQEQSIFPLCRQWADGYELPPARGVGVTVYYQDQNYRISELAATVPGMDVSALLGLSEIEIANDLYETNVKVDLWVLPFVNLFMLLGYIDGETVVDVSLLPQDLLIEYDGFVYGAGVTAAGCWKNLFVSFTATYTEADLDVSNSSIEALVLAPKCGINTRAGAFWLGGMYQQAEEKHVGTLDVVMDVDVGAVPISYDITLEQDEPWNYLAGFTTTINKRWELMIEGGLGDRRHVAMAATYRF